MPITLYESGAKDEKKKDKPETSILEGTVVNNCDPAMQGKVLVRVASINQEVWARLSSTGAGSGAGFFYTPRVDDEVLVALSGNDPVNAYIIGGLWNTQDSPPVSDPLEVMSKRVIKTGLAGGQGHKIEFDDGTGQSIVITTLTGQKITMDPFKIEMTNLAGTLKITMDNKTQSITLTAPVEIKLDAKVKITLSAATIKIGDMATTGMTTIQGGQVMIN